MTVLKPDAVLVTGGSGYVGGLIAGTLLADDNLHVLLPVRAHHDVNDLVWHVGMALSSMGRTMTDAHRSRLHVLPLPPLDDLAALDAVVAPWRVVEVVHCAGCLDYFDQEQLERINVRYTADMLESARRWGVDRFIYVSTAFASGYIAGTAPETVHDEPPEDPTDYSRTKRQAERLVAASGLPFLVVRPSIVIGTHDQGVYTGKRYGVYQLWSGLERLLCKRWEPVLHVVSNDKPIGVVHQDSFQWGFAAAREHLEANSFIHLTSGGAGTDAPTLADFWRLWNRDVAHASELVTYDRPEDVPLTAIPTRQRAFMSLGWENLKIASRHWHFATDNLARLRAKGLEFPDVTVASLERCQARFIGESETIAKFLSRLDAPLSA